MISTPSYPASFANSAARPKSFMVFRIPILLNAQGLNGEMGAFIALGATING